MAIISCIVPMYNSSKTIVRALESIRKQTYEGQLQIVVVDDGSQDDSVLLVEDFKSKNNKLWIDLVKKENGGVSSARNEGLKYIKGDYIAFLDSDDIWLSEKIKLQLNAIMENSSIDLLGSTLDDIILTKVLGRKVGRLIPLKPFGYAIKTQLVTSTVFFKREVYEKIGGFDENMKYSEDMNYWFRAMEFFNCYLLNIPLVIMEHNNNMKHAGGLSNKLWAMEKGELMNIKYIYNKGQINFGEFIFASVFSFLKFLRRGVFHKKI
ncbi:glycosyltransferase family 2 protein [Flavobacterium saccharophilum]|uniref:Glycosyltransferase involved in cell wall bisynthesis n=1 Tax=Flavobacterium saccharophilum TaxID=29534 RepID=A0A1M7K9M0_9FLAO|nr:glycosyltransferase family A protein [Flavobacterium saccharophilum]SHM61980.1 Glycosyltransferase involved in cell wall bisynthesis [Flavobacterium saccharophilum]